MPNLHELLAVHGSLEGQLTKCVTDLRETFQKKHHLFGEKLTTYTPLGEGETQIEEQSTLNTTVDKELKWIQEFFVKAINVSHKIDETNRTASADITLDDTNEILASSVPAVTLLELEKRLAVMHELFLSVPTLDPAKGFEADPSRPGKVFKAREVVKTRTAKKQRPLVLYEATKEHPAQVQLVSEDVPVGTIRQTEWSGMITPAAKAEILTRLEKLLRSVKQARARANTEVVVSSGRLGETLLNYVLGDLVK